MGCFFVKLGQWLYSVSNMVTATPHDVIIVIKKQITFRCILKRLFNKVEFVLRHLLVPPDFRTSTIVVYMYKCFKWHACWCNSSVLKPLLDRCQHTYIRYTIVVIMRLGWILFVRCRVNFHVWPAIHVYWCC